MRAALPLAGLILATVAGCDEAIDGLIAPATPNGLRIATNWPRQERTELAARFAEWLRDQPEPKVDVAAIVWVEIAEDEPIDRSLRRLHPSPDVLLGGDVAAHARLAAQGSLEALGDGASRPSWIVARSSPIALVGSGRLALADPREDPATRVWCLSRTAASWREGYADLLDRYGQAAPVGWRSGSARAAVADGRAGESLAAVDGADAAFAEAASIVKGAARPKAARAFLAFLQETKAAKPGPDLDSATAAAEIADASSLAADLLGATLVDAQDELRIAVAAVKAAGSPAWAVERLVAPPPWPPASIEKLLAKPGEDGPALVDALISQVSPDPGGRDWLARNWLKPRRDLDRTVLTELAAADAGSLAREPRFRAWLKAEWTQWARQRYRWVSRLAAKPPLVRPEGSS